MKMRTLRILSLMTAGILCISALAGCGSDPTVRQTEETKENYQVATEATGDEAENIYKFTAYPSGKTDPVTFKDVEVDVNAFALRSHELAYMIGETKFDSPDELSVDAATQFGFTHIFYEDFYKIDNRAVAFRTVKSEPMIWSRTVILPASRNLREGWVHIMDSTLTGLTETAGSTTSSFLRMPRSILMHA